MRSNLTFQQTFCDGQIFCRFLKPPTKQELVIAVIPGGPDLSNQYLEEFLLALASRTGLNVCLVDLPNHGRSKVTVNDKTPTYSETLELVERFVRDLISLTRSVVLFGQSYGARLAFDITANLEQKPLAAFLTGFPYKFQISSGLAARFETLPLLEESGENSLKIREANSRKILPLYLVQPIPARSFEALLVKEGLTDGYQMLLGAPPIEDSAKRITKEMPLLILEAGGDPVVPDGNWNFLRSIVPHARFVEMQDVGHFPMVESQEGVLRIFSDFISKVRGHADEK